MGLTAKEQAQLAKLQAKAAEPEPVVPAPVVSEPTKAEAAQSLLVEMGLKQAKPNPFRKIDCAYGACQRIFDPNGDGPWHHSSCPVGSQLFGLFQKAKKADGTEKGPEYERVLAQAKEIAAKLS